MKKWQVAKEVKGHAPCTQDRQGPSIREWVFDAGKMSGGGRLAPATFANGGLQPLRSTPKRAARRQARRQSGLNSCPGLTAGRSGGLGSGAAGDLALAHQHGAHGGRLPRLDAAPLFGAARRRGALAGILSRRLCVHRRGQRRCSSSV